MLLILAIAATGAMLSYAKPILAPVLFAMVVGVVVSPLADRLHALGIPRVLIAASLLFVTTGLLVLAFIALEPLLTAMANRLPEIRAEIESWIETASGLLRGIETISNEIEQTVGTPTGVEVDDGPELPSVMDAIWLAPNLGASVLTFAGTLFFFVLGRTDLYNAAGRWRVALFRADRAVARYFATLTLVNIALGAATALALTLVGLENALLWGLAAGVLNYILYLGPLAILLGLLVAGLMQFGGAMAVLPPLVFLSLNITEAQFVTPAVVGQRLQISPLAVFLAIVFGLWLWGPVGAIVALPASLWLAVLAAPEAQRRRASRAPRRAPRARPDTRAPRT